MKPLCYNRPARHTGYLANDERLYTGGYQSVQAVKTIPVAFVDRCATWDGTGIGPNGEPYPIAHGWDCAGCRWLPDGVILPVNTASLESNTP